MAKVSITMTTGSWDPNINNKRESLSINQADLAHFINLSREEQLSSIESHLSETQLQVFPGLIERSIQQWQAAAENLSQDEIWHLIRFWTVAEKISGWECAEKSPVIALNKLLKKRKQPLSKDQLLWIKAQSDNHFLPNGPLLM